MKYKKKSPAAYFQIKKNIDQLKKLVLEKKEHDYQLKLIKKIIDGVPVTGITISNNKLYRARYNLSKELFKESKDLIYPPSSLAQKGRFNESKKSIFYAATSALGTIIELRPKINKFFTITATK